MHMSRLFVMSCLLGSALVACGDDGGGGGGMVDAPKQIDAAIDSPPAVTCTYPASLPAGMVGTMAMPASGNFIVKDNMNRVFFGLSIYITQDMKNDITLIVPRPTAGFAPGTFNFDPNPMSTMPVALAYGEQGINGMTSEKTLYATSGSITFTAIGQTANSPIRGSISMTQLKEVDAQGNFVTGGCMSTIAGLSFFLTQMTTVTKTGPDQPAGSETWKLEMAGQPAQFLTVP